MPPGSLREIAAVFLKLGTSAFGGPAAHVAMMSDEIVNKRAWVTQTEFLDALSATNFIPGPNSTELAIHLGYVRGGWRGLVVAGVCFIMPAAVIVAFLAWCYVVYGNLPWSHARNARDFLTRLSFCGVHRSSHFASTSIEHRASLRRHLTA